ncbi:SAM-dependent methyltransferase [Persicitalea jodogahamensis]|uniref:SAM-dependent methyltransferase n=2 Tax=Persicitalea jodogahamensis TaxID=402147 RepID=A0A8J3D4N2_9BACT|nr:SAM-dependent methyltransferase [Persicitalea jodogahamensis]
MNRVEEGVVTLNLPEFKGRFKMSAKSHIFKRVIIDNCFEPTTVALTRKYANRRDLIDVGANIGLFSVLFSNIASITGSRVLSIEPNSQALGFLHENLSVNVPQKKNVIVYEGIATDEPKNYDFNFIEGMSEYSSTSEIVHPAVMNETISHSKVEGDTLDNLVDKHGLQPGFIKIDVEGGEREVLNGASLTIDRYRPIILLEINDFASLSERISPFYSNYFQQRNYKILNHSLRAAKEPYIGDYVCFPNEYVLN